MYSTGQELFKDSESYLSELNDDFTIPIDGFDFMYRSMSESFDTAADLSLAAIHIATLAISSPDCGVSIKLTRLLEVSATHCHLFSPIYLPSAELCNGNYLEEQQGKQT